MTDSRARVEATLARYGALIHDSMEEFLPGGRTPDYLYDLMREYPRRGGKGIRPALLLAACQAYGGSARDGLGPAVALEMMHNAFLIHDDIEDASARRRGRPTLHEMHGVGLAVNAGDALACRALEPLRSGGAFGGRLARQLLGEFLTMVRETTEGQALELGWRRDNVIDLTPGDYLRLAGKKTCWYTCMAPMRVGALAGSRGTASLRALSRFGFHLGAAFQIRDDLLNLSADDALQGKERFGDIREGKRTLMLIHLLRESPGAERAWLVDYLATPEGERTPAAVWRVFALMRRYGSVDFAREYAAGITAGAYSAFDEAFGGVPPSVHVDFLRAVIPYMLARTV
jgi:geranylgeranyl diphosphate synthase, type II